MANQTPIRFAANLPPWHWLVVFFPWIDFALELHTTIPENRTSITYIIIGLETSLQEGTIKVLAANGVANVLDVLVHSCIRQDVTVHRQETPRVPETLGTATRSARGSSSSQQTLRTRSLVLQLICALPGSSGLERKFFVEMVGICTCSPAHSTGGFSPVEIVDGVWGNR